MDVIQKVSIVCPMSPRKLPFATNSKHGSNYLNIKNSQSLTNGTLIRESSKSTTTATTITTTTTATSNPPQANGLSIKSQISSLLPSVVSTLERKKSSFSASTTSTINNKPLDAETDTVQRFLNGYKGMAWRSDQLIHQIPAHDKVIISSINTINSNHSNVHSNNYTNNSLRDIQFLQNQLRQSQLHPRLYHNEHIDCRCFKCDKLISIKTYCVMINMRDGLSTLARNTLVANSIGVNQLATPITIPLNPLFCHIDCFSCTICGEVVVDFRAYINSTCDSKTIDLYCFRHFLELYKPRCAYCDQLIMEITCTEAEDKAWHINCFRCYECKRSLGGEQYVMAKPINVYNNNSDKLNSVNCEYPYCLTCFDSLFGELCEECGELISCGIGSIKHDSRHWHANENCFKCNYCLKPLLGKPFLPANDGKIYCSTICHQNIIKIYHAKSCSTLRYSTNNCNSLPPQHPSQPPSTSQHLPPASVPPSLPSATFLLKPSHTSQPPSRPTVSPPPPPQLMIRKPEKTEAHNYHQHHHHQYHTYELRQVLNHDQPLNTDPVDTIEINHVIKDEEKKSLIDHVGNKIVTGKDNHESDNKNESPKLEKKNHENHVETSNEIKNDQKRIKSQLDNENVNKSENDKTCHQSSNTSPSMSASASPITSASPSSASEISCDNNSTSSDKEETNKNDSKITQSNNIPSSTNFVAEKPASPSSSSSSSPPPSLTLRPQERVALMMQDKDRLVRPSNGADYVVASHQTIIDYLKDQIYRERMLVSSSATPTATASIETFIANSHHHPYPSPAFHHHTQASHPDSSSSAINEQQSKSPSPPSFINGLPEVPYTLPANSANGFKTHSISSSSESTPLLVRTSVMNDKPDVIRNYVNIEPKMLKKRREEEEKLIKEESKVNQIKQQQQLSEVQNCTQLNAEIHNIPEQSTNSSMDVNHHHHNHHHHHHHPETKPKSTDAKEVIKEESNKDDEEEDKIDVKDSLSPTNSEASSSGNEVKAKSVTFDPNIKETDKTRRIKIKSIKKFSRDEDACSTCSSSSCSSSCSSEDDDDYDYDLKYSSSSSSSRNAQRFRGTRIHYVNRNVNNDNYRRTIGRSAQSEGSLRRNTINSNSINYRRANTETCILS